MEKYENFTYELDGNLYINLTSKCPNDCTFCVRNEKSDYFGHKLWLSREPGAEEVISRLPDDIKNTANMYSADSVNRRSNCPSFWLSQRRSKRAAESCGSTPTGRRT